MGDRDDFRLAGTCASASLDYERLPETAVAMIYTAMSRLMLRRLEQLA